MKQYPLYLFDFDYTLVNSEAAILKCFHITLAKTGYPSVSDEKIKHTIGLPMRSAVKIILDTTDDQKARAFLDVYRIQADRYMTEGTHFFPYTLGVLRTLKQRGAKIAIISNKTDYRIQEKFDVDHVPELVDYILGSNTVARPKPDADGCNKALQHFGLSKADALYIGDSEVDAQTAANAGLDFAAVTSGTTSAEALAAYPHVAILHDLTELLA